MENKISLERIQYRVGQTYYEADRKKLKGVSFLVYIDARTAQEQLDEKFGPENWKFKWEKVEDNKWAVKGILTVKMGDEWITREDVGYPQENKKNEKDIDNALDKTEWLKDAVSDSLKRCAVQFGVGRFLYDAPFLYAKREDIEVSLYNDVERFRKLTTEGEIRIKADIKKWYEGLK
jgi:hypothetical protein